VETTEIFVKWPRFRWNYRNFCDVIKISMKLPKFLWKWPRFRWNYRAFCDVTKISVKWASFLWRDQDFGEMTELSVTWPRFRWNYRAFCESSSRDSIAV
jgi:hypothetical protein